MMKACVVSVDGNAERGYVNGFIDTMPLLDARELRKVYKAISPQNDIKGDFSCANCGHEQELEVPLGANFFWPDA